MVTVCKIHVLQTRKWCSSYWGTVRIVSIKPGELKEWLTYWLHGAVRQSEHGAPCSFRCLCEGGEETHTDTLWLIKHPLHCCDRLWHASLPWSSFKLTIYPVCLSTTVITFSTCPMLKSGYCIMTVWRWAFHLQFSVKWAVCVSRLSNTEHCKCKVT